MKIKTIGDLRNLILENDGTLTIGKLSFVHEKDKDIDIHFDGNLIQWIGSGVGDGAKFVGEDYFSISNDIDEWREATEEVVQLKNKLALLEKNAKESSLAEGKVAAYEKLLVGRTVSIGQ